MSTSVDADIQREHAYQREHLEKTISALKKRLTSDNQHHHEDNVRVMQVRDLQLMLPSQPLLAFLTVNKCLPGIPPGATNGTGNHLLPYRLTSFAVRLFTVANGV